MQHSKFFSSAARVTILEKAIMYQFVCTIFLSLPACLLAYIADLFEIPMQFMCVTNHECVVAFYIFHVVNQFNSKKTHVRWL